jgi:transposase
MARRMLTDELWSNAADKHAARWLTRGILRQHRIYDKPFLREMVEGMLYRLRVGCPWRDLPAEFGCWNTIFQKFNRWSSQNKLMMIFKMLIQEPDLEWEFIDGSIVKAHQHSAGAAKDENQAIGKSVAGNTTKIHMVVDGFGLPIEFEITGGEAHDCKIAPKLLDKLPSSEYVIADKGYDMSL